jgi:hypothetical protein
VRTPGSVNAESPTAPVNFSQAGSRCTGLDSFAYVQVCVLYKYFMRGVIKTKIKIKRTITAKDYPRMRFPFALITFAGTLAVPLIRLV